MKQTAIIVLRQNKKDDWEFNEFKSLVESADYEVIHSIRQIRKEDSKYNIGKGKILYLKNLIDELMPDKVIFGNDLKPNQYVNILKELNIEDERLLDRIMLVLEIFDKRAGTLEAKLQIELARTSYYVSIYKEKIKQIKKKEKPGFHGLGRYPVDAYYRELNKRMIKLKEKISSLRKHREIHRRYRKRKGFYIVSLVGYTNAGKSTLLNKLTNSNVPVDQKMFTTLGTYTRLLPENHKNYHNNGSILITDTIGFVYNLPPFLIDAFLSTLEEITYSDLILIVLDLSDPLEIIIKKITTCNEILAALNANDIPKILVLNKIDIVSKDKVNQVKSYLTQLFDKIISISAKNEINLEILKQEILKIKDYLMKKHQYYMS